MCACVDVLLHILLLVLYFVLEGFLLDGDCSLQLKLHKLLCVCVILRPNIIKYIN